MINALGKDIVAEGIETEETAQYLLNHNCKILQGYLYSKPLPIDAFTAWLKATK